MPSPYNIFHYGREELFADRLVHPVGRNPLRRMANCTALNGCDYELDLEVHSYTIACQKQCCKVPSSSVN